MFYNEHTWLSQLENENKEKFLPYKLDSADIP